MSTSTLRNMLRHSPPLRRMSSAAHNPVASASQKKEPQLSLPPQKMRALISLYHQAQTFVTPETLDEAIDRAFITDVEISRAAFMRDQSMFELRRQLMERKLLPKIGSGRDVSVAGASDVFGLRWTERKAERERKVLGALYGLDRTGKPGLELLEEEEERIQKHLTEDKGRQTKA